MAEDSLQNKKQVTIAQLIGFAITVVGSMLVFWSNTQTRLTVLEMQMKSSDIDRGRIENKIDRLNLKSDDMSDKLSEIKAIYQQTKKTNP
jgi:flagellar biosynthesis/type III secretory pathway M-ring protein FliF/YscJ